MVRSCMRVTCEQCRVAYELQDDRIPPGGAQVQCTACSHVFLVRNDAVEDTVTFIGPAFNRTETELQHSLIADLKLLRTEHERAPEYLGGDEPTVLSPKTKERHGLREIANVRQVRGESPRRWFTSTDLDLILWLGPGGKPHGFQLCYGKRENNERAVTWWPERGLTHSSVNADGREHSGMKGTPTLSDAPGYEAAAVLARFLATKGDLAPEYVDFVAQRLQPAAS
jgi:predicted Zn finger-like uncharacterized protein